MPCSATQWLAIAQGILTGVVAIITSYIAWQQWQGNKLKLKMERYDRCLRVYQEVVKMVKTCANEGPEWKDIMEFGAATAEADFLFGPEIPAYLTEITKRAAQLRVANKSYRHLGEPLPPNYGHQKIVDEMSEQSEWFVEQITGAHLKNKFAPYLNISHQG